MPPKQFLPCLAAQTPSLDAFQFACSALPKSPLGEAFGYALSNWVALNTFVEHGILEADNNWGERALKPVVMACS
jgi:hypothetical protein